MPKVVPNHRRTRSYQVQQRCDQHNSHHHVNPRASAVTPSWMTSPRQVSFEEGHQSNPSFKSSQATAASSTSLASSSAATAACQGIPRSRSLLRRKPPSVCLVDLARGDECTSPLPSGGNSSSSGDESVVGSGTSSPSTGPCSSPWGHFVDMLIPLDENEEDITYHTHNSSRRAMIHNAPGMPTSFSSSRRHERGDAPYPTFQPRRRSYHHRHRATNGRCMTPPVGDYPTTSYGLTMMTSSSQGQRRERAGSFSSSKASSFLPGLVLDDVSSSPLEETKEVEVAMERLKF